MKYVKTSFTIDTVMRICIDLKEIPKTFWYSLDLWRLGRTHLSGTVDSGTRLT